MASGFSTQKLFVSKSKGLVVCYLISFVSNVGFLIVIPSLSYFLADLGYDGDSNIVWVGVAMSAFAFGQIISSPIFGKACDRYNITGVLIVSLICTMIGDVLYALSGNLWELLCARFLTGFGAGNQAVIQSFMIATSSIDLRTSRMSLLALTISLSSAVGPAIALALSTVHFRVFDQFHFDSYTAPGYVSAVLGILDLILVVAFVRDRSKIVIETDAVYDVLSKNDELSDDDEEIEEYTPLVGNPRPSSHHLRYDSPSLPSPHDAQRQSNSHHHHNNNKDDNHNDSSTTNLLATRSDALKGLAVISKLNSYQSVRRALPILLILMYTNFAIFTSSIIFTTLLTPLIIEDYQWNVQESCILWTGIGALALLSFSIHICIKSSVVKDNVALGIGMLMMAVGWAIFTTFESQHIPKHRFIVGTVLLAIGLPWAMASCYALFSKVLGNIEQGLLFGFLVATGSLASLLGPIWSTLLYRSTDGFILFPIISCILISANIFNLMVYKMSKYMIWLNSVPSDFGE